MPKRLAVLAALGGMSWLLLTACGGGGGSALAQTASCSMQWSELGPFSSSTALGQSMTEDEARARMEREGIEGWVVVSAVGPWDTAWDLATSRLGQGIHADLTWIDVDGELSNLFEVGDAFEFRDLRVTRSFQGKIEHTTDPLYLPLQADRSSANVDAGCSITSLDVGDVTNDALADVLDGITIDPANS